MDNEKEDIILSNSGEGQSHYVELIMKDKGVSRDDIIIIGAGELGAREKIIQMLKDGVPAGKILIIENIDHLIREKSMPSVDEIRANLRQVVVKLSPPPYTDIDEIKNLPYKADKPFAKFQGKQKWQR